MLLLRVGGPAAGEAPMFGQSACSYHERRFFPETKDIVQSARQPHAAKQESPGAWRLARGGPMRDRMAAEALAGGTRMARESLAGTQHRGHMGAMKLSLEADPPVPQAMIPTVLEAIVRQRCLSATYNRTRMILAPHILYGRNGGLYVDGVVVSREGMIPREEKVGSFKLDGLKALTLLERAFVVSALFDATQEKYRAETLMAVEPGAAQG